MDHQFDYINLKTEKDIKIAKEKLKYSVLLQEEILSKGFRNLRTNLTINLKSNFKRSFLNLGMKIVTGYLINQIQTRTSKKY